MITSSSYLVLGEHHLECQPQTCALNWRKNGIRQKDTVAEKDSAAVAPCRALAATISRALEPPRPTTGRGNLLKRRPTSGACA